MRENGAVAALAECYHDIVGEALSELAHQKD